MQMECSVQNVLSESFSQNRDLLYNSCEYSKANYSWVFLYKNFQPKRFDF